MNVTIQNVDNLTKNFDVMVQILNLTEMTVNLTKMLRRYTPYRAMERMRIEVDFECSTLFSLVLARK